MISLIAAMASNRAIGIDNKIPWKLPEDMKFFKQTTMGHPIIMGRKTFESFGGRTLPGRTNIILTRNKNYKAENTYVFQQLDAAIEFAKTQTGGQKECFIIGGEEIYRLAIPIANRIYLTEIETEIAGDSFFPNFPTSFLEKSRTPGQNQTPRLDFVLYERNA